MVWKLLLLVDLLEMSYKPTLTMVVKWKNGESLLFETESSLFEMGIIFVALLEINWKILNLVSKLFTIVNSLHSQYKVSFERSQFICKCATNIISVSFFFCSRSLNKGYSLNICVYWVYSTGVKSKQITQWEHSPAASLMVTDLLHTHKHTPHPPPPYS